MSQSKEQVAQAALQTVDNFFDGVFKILADWQPRVQTDIAAKLKSGALTGAALAQLVETESVRILSQAELPIYGAGFCASEAVVAQGNPLAWWQGPDHTPLASSTFGVGPGAVDLRRLEWYRVPESTGKQSVAGPFVDYLCSNEVTITSSLPLFIDTAFAGVLCLDVLVADLESAMMPLLKSAKTVTVININRRIVLSTDNSSETGDRIAVERLEGPEALVLNSTKYPFAVVIEE